nr:oligosaccharide flippase family protein [uncultured Methanobacterium sp.]
MKRISLQYLKSFKHHLNDSLLKESYYLFVSYVLVVASGFIFWLVGARYYSPEDLGVASAIVSIIGLISMLSFLGFDIALVKYIPEMKNKKELINSCLTVAVIFSAILTLIFIAGINLWSPSLVILRENSWLTLFFLIFIITSTLSTLQGFGVFPGFKKAEYSLIQNLTIPFRILFLLLLIPFGVYGLFISYGLVYIFAFVVGMFLTSKIFDYGFSLTIKKGILSDIFNYSSGNYFARIFENLPTFLLPLLILNILGATQNAYFYIAWQISMLLLAIPYVMYIALLAESNSQIEDIKKNIRKALKLVFVAMVIAFMGILIFGKYLLSIFGDAYTLNSYNLLLLFALGNFLYFINTLYATVNRILKNTIRIIVVYASISSTTLLLSYFLMGRWGLMGVGYAWIISNAVVLLFTLPLLKRSYL